MAKARQDRIAHEVAEASRATTGKQRRGYPASLIAEARELEKELMKRRKLRKELKRIEQNIRHKKRMLKALAGAEMGEEL